jgi:hypothetical protein
MGRREREKEGKKRKRRKERCRSRNEHCRAPAQKEGGVCGKLLGAAGYCLCCWLKGWGMLGARRLVSRRSTRLPRSPLIKDDEMRGGGGGGGGGEQQQRERERKKDENGDNRASNGRCNNVGEV